MFPAPGVEYEPDGPGSCGCIIATRYSLLPPLEVNRSPRASSPTLVAQRTRAKKVGPIHVAHIFIRDNSPRGAPLHIVRWLGKTSSVDYTVIYPSTSSRFTLTLTRGCPHLQHAPPRSPTSIPTSTNIYIFSKYTCESIEESRFYVIKFTVRDTSGHIFTVCVFK